jgi:hypothetical protein
MCGQAETSSSNLFRYSMFRKPHCFSSVLDNGQTIQLPHLERHTSPTVMNPNCAERCALVRPGTFPRQLRLELFEMCRTDCSGYPLAYFTRCSRSGEQTANRERSTDPAQIGAAIWRTVEDVTDCFSVILRAFDSWRMMSVACQYAPPKTPS